MPAHDRSEQLPAVVLPSCPIHKSLRGQKALVTGANSGIGKGIAIALGYAGADVVVNYASGADKCSGSHLPSPSVVGTRR